MGVQKNGRDILNDSDINNPDIDGGTIDNATGTNLTLVTPALGTPASGALTNCTGLPAAGLVPGTAESDFICATTTPFTWVKKTLVEAKALLGLVITAGKTITVTQDTSLDEAVAMSSKVTKGGSGQVINPTLPAFLAFNTSTDLNVTGDGTVVTVDFDTEVFDQGGNFAADTFTAPVTGKYHFDTLVQVTGLAAGIYCYVRIVTSNRHYDKVAFFLDPTRSLFLSVLADMDAGDTAYVSLEVGGGTKVVNIVGQAEILYTFFSGHLVC